MEQPAGLQVDYMFRGVEHAVRVVVSGQVLELEVEDRMTADQWRGEFDANCECACWGGLLSPPWSSPKAEAEPSCALASSQAYQSGAGVWVPSVWPEAVRGGQSWRT